MKEMNLKILITGASTGIGKDIAVSLAKLGCKVFAGIRKKADKIELEKLDKNITGVYLDVTNTASVDKAFWYVLKNTEKLDVLINNAGIALAGPVEVLPIKKIKEQFDVNTFGALNVAQKFLPLLHNGKIINISSMAAYGIFPYISPYCASKRALDIMFNALELENKDNIKVISIKPAVIKTPIWNKSVKKANEIFEEYNESAKEKYSRELLLLQKNALDNTTKGLSSKCVVNKVIKVIKSNNSKSSYNIGSKAYFAEILSKFSVDFINKLIKFKLKHIK